MDRLIWNELGIAGILLFVVCLTGVPLESFVYAQVTIIPGTDGEDTETTEEPEPEAEPEPEGELGSQQLLPQLTTPGPERVSQELDYAHFIPLTNSPGNQVKLIVNYTTEDTSFVNEPINAIMEVYGTNQSLIKQSSFSEPMIANNSGTLQLATTFTSEEINNVNIVSTITDSEKLVYISKPISLNLNLGQVVER